MIFYPACRAAALGAALLIPLGGCWPIAVAGAGAGGYAVGMDDRPVTQISRDAMITAEVNSRLLAESELSFMDIDVDTHNGLVTLTGTADDRAQLDNLIAHAREVRGVTGVVPNVQVINPQAGTAVGMMPDPYGAAPVFNPQWLYPLPESSGSIVPPTDPTVAYGYRNAYPNHTILVPKQDGSYVPTTAAQGFPAATPETAPPAPSGYAANPNYNPTAATAYAQPGVPPAIPAYPPRMNPR